MGFNIFAAGTSGFNYSRDNCADGDLFEAAAVMNAMREAGPDTMGVVQGVQEYAAPSADDGFRTAIQSNLGLAMRAHLGDGVTLLASCGRASQGGWISVAAERSRALGVLPPATAVARYGFFPNVHPASEFMAQVTPALTATSLNNWGVMLEIDRALRLYYSHIHGRGQPMIQIQLTK